MPQTAWRDPPACLGRRGFFSPKRRGRGFHELRGAGIQPLQGGDKGFHIGVAILGLLCQCFR